MALIKRNDSLHLVPEANNDEVHTVLGEKSFFEGKLVYQGSVRIDGEFKGEIESEDLLILGESAQVSAKLSVGTLIIKGSFTGTATVNGRAEFKKNARVIADIITKSLVIEEGVLFDGQCRMFKNNERPDNAQSTNSSQNLVN
jgi:cytoskeletal protein CcmA (bactofilin family)